MTDEPKKKKIIIDEDWKSQVEAEREAAKNPEETPADETAAAGGASDQMVWPEPSLPLLLTTLATQAMAAMGLMAYPDGGQTQVDLPQAKHFIDTIDMLQQKTQGNCTPDETSLFESALHELRMAYVAVEKKQMGQ